MVSRPATVLTVEPCSEFTADGMQSERVQKFAKVWQQRRGLPLPECTIRVESVAPQHVGLGSGTQLAMSVATALHCASEIPLPTASELSRSVGRGHRSCIGSHGFFEGGLLFELGRESDEAFAEIEARVELPEAWRVVQLRPRQQAGLSGHAELIAFDKLPAVPAEATNALLNEVRENILPAAWDGNFLEFSESVYRYGLLAGECFTQVQGGPFANPTLDSWVQDIRGHGVAGVGQSSWGPSLFVLQETKDAAQDFVQWFHDEISSTTESHSIISTISNQGVKISEVASA